MSSCVNADIQFFNTRYGVNNWSFSSLANGEEYIVYVPNNVLEISREYKVLPDESVFISATLGKEHQVYKKTSDTVYRPFALSLGDLWRDLRFVTSVAEKTNKPVKITTSYVSSRRRYKTVDEKIREALPLFEKADMIELVENEFSTEPKLDWKTAALYARGKTKAKWNGADSRTVAYQFDGKRVGNLPPEDGQKTLRFLKDNGFKTTHLGWHNSLEEAVNILSEARFFIGVSSGFSHIAGTVGCPTILFRQKLSEEDVKYLHGNMKLILAESLFTSAKPHLMNLMEDVSYFFENCRNEI